MIDDHNASDHEATGDSNVLFSEFRLSDDIESSVSTGTVLGTDFHLSRLDHQNISDQTTLSSLLKRSNSIASIEKVIRIFLVT